MVKWCKDAKMAAYLTRDVAECALGCIGFPGCATGRRPIIFVFSFEGSNSL